MCTAQLAMALEMYINLVDILPEIKPPRTTQEWIDQSKVPY
jgi:hypothetical protein